MHTLYDAAMKKRITDRMNVKETFSNSLILYHAFLLFLFVRDLVAENKNLKEIAKDFIRENTTFRVIFLIFNMRLMPLIVLILGVIELNLDFLNKED